MVIELRRLQHHVLLLHRSHFPFLDFLAAVDGCDILRRYGRSSIFLTRVFVPLRSGAAWKVDHPFLVFLILLADGHVKA